MRIVKMSAQCLLPHLASAAPINTLEQLMHAPRVTTRIAGSVPDALLVKGFSNLDKSAAGSEQLYRMLLAGRTDIIVDDTPAGVASYAHKLNVPPAALRRIPVEMYRSSLYIAFSPGSDDEVVNAWANALATLRNSGALARIQRRYEHWVR